MHRLEEIFKQSNGATEYVDLYFKRISEVLANIKREDVDKVIEVVEQGIASDRTLICIANGGSSSVASHFVNDAVASAAVEGKNPFRVISLSDNGESITAIANDTGFENIFLVQLKAAMRPGDAVLAMSVSGNSPNLVSAMEWAKANGGKTIAWVGMEGGKLAEIADCVVHLPSTRDEYGPIEDSFSILMHSVFTYIAMKRGRKLYH